MSVPAAFRLGLCRPGTPPTGAERWLSSDCNSREAVCHVGNGDDEGEFRWPPERRAYRQSVEQVGPSQSRGLQKPLEGSEILGGLWIEAHAAPAGTVPGRKVGGGKEESQLRGEAGSCRFRRRCLVLAAHFEVGAAAAVHPDAPAIISPAIALAAGSIAVLTQQPHASTSVYVAVVAAHVVG